MITRKIDLFKLVGHTLSRHSSINDCLANELKGVI